MRFKRFLNISQKVSFQFPIWKLPELMGEGLFIFFPQDPLEIFCYCEFALKNPQRVYSQMFSHTPFRTDPQEFSHPPSPWSVPWHRLMQGANPISWTGLSCSNSFLQHQLTGSDGLCLPALSTGLCGGSSGSWFQPPACQCCSPSFLRLQGSFL